MAIHETAIVDSKAEIDPTVEIGPYAVVEGPVRIGANTKILHHGCVSGWTEIGQGCEIHPFAVVGGPPQDLTYHGEESWCRIGDETIIREGATIHRSATAGAETRIGNGCLIMATCHIGHDCRFGDRVIQASGSALAGHVQVGDGVFIGGTAGIHQFVRIGELAMIGGVAAISMDVPPFFMATHFSECTGINLVGMKRAGYGRAECTELRNAYKCLYRSGLSFSEAVEKVAATVDTEPGRRLVEFLRAPSKRGISGARRRDSAGP
ncbi:MAG: acyl-ACP--UDP-N-acetylglucosamine O-acyltransferase [Phycisphaerae bacterium]